MTLGEWGVVIGAVWLGVSVVAAPLVGRHLRRMQPPEPRHRWDGDPRTRPPTH